MPRSLTLDPKWTPPSMPRGWRRVRHGAKLHPGDRFWYTLTWTTMTDTMTACFTHAIHPVVFIRRSRPKSP